MYEVVFRIYDKLSNRVVLVKNVSYIPVKDQCISLFGNIYLVHQVLPMYTTTSIEDGFFSQDWDSIDTCVSCNFVISLELSEEG
jgi:hypothetical protein